jgi:predicted aldo/keto reductase-like oxidoreductase
MKYRTLGKTGLEVSLLSFGCMRLPEDEDEAAALISAGADRGLNYFETAPGYCNGTCERKVGLGLRGRREQVLVSAKSFVKDDTDADAMRRSVEASLAALQTDYLDFYQFWGFRLESWDNVRKPGGALEAIRKLQGEGVIRHFGFTSHDTPENVITLLETGEFESATLVYNILYTDQEPAIATARDRGVGIVVMCPVSGGLLANPSREIQDLFPGASDGSGSAELALRFAWSCRGVTTTPSGMERMEDLEQNLAAVKRFEPLAESDRARVLEVLEQFRAVGDKFCTGCRYCLPCPNDVWIPGIFKLVNYARLYGLADKAKIQYSEWSEKHGTAVCSECGECEPKCPHGIPIIAQLKEAAELFGDALPQARPEGD